MDTTIRTAIPTTDRIGITGITDLTIGTAGTGITIVTTDITTTIVGNKLTEYLEIQIELAREQCRASFFSGAARIKNRGPAAISLVWATLPILWPDPWLVDQSGTLFSVA